MTMALPKTKPNSPPIFCVQTTLDRPICRAEQKRIYGVGRNEAVRILCEVDSFPPPKSFKWTFNNTAETIDMPQNGFEKHTKSSSKLLYTPVKVSKPISPPHSPNVPIPERNETIMYLRTQRRNGNENVRNQTITEQIDIVNQSTGDLFRMCVCESIDM